MAQLTLPSPVEADRPAEQTPRAADKDLRWHRGDIALYAGLFAASALFALPFAWLLLTSLKPPAEVFDKSWIPSRIEGGNYEDVFDAAPVWRWMLNTTIVSILAVVSVVFSSSLVAYGFARLKFRGRTQLFALVIATYLLPGAVTLIPTFLIWNKIGAVNTFFPLWAGNLFGSAFYIFMLRQFMLTIPRDLTDAARVDGASYFRIYWNIIVPLVRPALVAVAIFEFEAKWNDFITPLIYINDRDLYTLALGLASFKEQFKELGSQWALLMAASVIFTLPMIALFFVFQRYFMEGVAHSGIKG